MSVHLEFNYGKKLGLPGYSSHNFTVSVRSEVSKPEDIMLETQRVYSILQESVDSQIIRTGFVPGQNGQNTNQGQANPVSEGNVPRFPGNDRQSPSQGHQDASSWKCSPKQAELILKILAENQLTQGYADKMANELHGKPMSALTKLEASGVVSEFISRYRRSRNVATNSKHGGAGQ
jgi:hypothetical protein